MSNKKDGFVEKIYPAQKTLQMKAGTGNISDDKIAMAEGTFGTQKDFLKDEVKKLLKALQRQSADLDKMIGTEDFVSAPEKRQIVTDIVTTLMNIKSGIGYSEVPELNDLTSLVLETFDDAKTFSNKTSTAMRDYISLISDFCDKGLTDASLKEIRETMTSWSDLKKIN